MKRKICVVTGSRAEYGVLYPTLKAIASARDLQLQLVVTGMHLSPAFGLTVKEIEADGFPIAGRVKMLVSSAGETDMGKSIAKGVMGLVDCYKRLKPDIVLLIADRFEMLAAAVAAMTVNLPIAHISGGEISEGAMDEQIRHAITKMSHIHFVAIKENAMRVRQMGEEPWRIKTVGGPWMDNIRGFKPLTADQISSRLGIELKPPLLLVTYHPVTLEQDKSDEHIKALFGALAEIDTGEIIFTYPNADAGGMKIIRAIKAFQAKRPNVKAFKNLGRQMYFSLLPHVDMMVGNSSSGILESLGFYLPVVNVGNRQKGRFTTGNIISVPDRKKEILKAIRKAMEPAFRKKIRSMPNPYGRGNTARNITEVLRTVNLGPAILRKKFCTIPMT
ncbi:MAG: UDP-N-acetylglucosamine 2-epimerase (hydrolyzing) [Candidatus Omnitrophica bacterium]|nr:UDP-N-acetylglucosamine 2-epimerase (hydrolyzing) [Candidatus Omnitrophota bacterium]MDE2223237.1 UDP-N-acetylglucosamine 2-epimerase (hydrolyzing) [Candidatus Omnitrophota bacterium]